MHKSGLPGWLGTRVRRISLTFALVAWLPLVAATPAEAAMGTPLITETFAGATAEPGFEAYGAACLTGATPGGLPGPGLHPLGSCAAARTGPVPPTDGAPFGYLQLSDASTNQSGAVLFNHPIPAAEGLEVSFDQWQYGSTTPANPADGISFFLVNGEGGLTAPGAFGGSLGYGSKLPNDDAAMAVVPGVDQGYLGVGLDVLGNYFGDWEHRGNLCPTRSPAGTIFRVPGPGANMVTVRGPGHGTAGYCFLAATTSNLTTTGPWPSTLPGRLQGTTVTMPPGATPAQADAILAPDRRTVTIRISPAPDPVVTVFIDFNDGRGQQQVLTFAAPQPVPPTYKLGFAASTGLFTDVHLIRNVHISTLLPAPALDLVKQIDIDTPLPVAPTVGEVIPYEFTLTNTGLSTLAQLTVADPQVGTVHCPVTTLAPGDSTVCTATYRVTAADVTRGYLRNVALATAAGPGGRVDSPPSEFTLPLGGRVSLALIKEADTGRVYQAGQAVRYTYVVSNVSTATVRGVTIDDDRVSNVTCAATTLQPHDLPGDSTLCQATHIVTVAEAALGNLTNTAVASANGGSLVSPPASVTILLRVPPQLPVTGGHVGWLLLLGIGVCAAGLATYRLGNAGVRRQRSANDI